MNDINNIMIVYIKMNKKEMMKKNILYKLNK